MLKKWQLFLIVLVLVVPLVLAACGDDDGGDNGDKGVELNQTLDSASGISLKYPDGWVVKDDVGMGQIYLANSQETMDAINSDESDIKPKADQHAVMLMGPVPLAMMGEGINMEDAFKQMSESMAAEDEETEVGEIESLKVGGQDAYKAKVTDADTEGFILGMDIGDGNMIIASGVGAKGELDKFEDTAMKIIESVTYTAPAGEESGEG
ncbi:MAG: hypothetical protein JW966_05710 [Anaerolineae bacterium]|nr:hypothetical protein [Anaerolineae bacterium]